jgi:hypothetical protein
LRRLTIMRAAEDIGELIEKQATGTFLFGGSQGERCAAFTFGLDILMIKAPRLQCRESAFIVRGSN